MCEPVRNTNITHGGIVIVGLIVVAVLRTRTDLVILIGLPPRHQLQTVC
jgi:hypothetical protein